MAIYRGVRGVNRKIKDIYRGVCGVNRRIKEEWRGVKGVNRKVFSPTPLRGVLFPGINSDDEIELLPLPFDLAWRLENFDLTPRNSFKLNKSQTDPSINSKGFSFKGYKQLKINYTLVMAEPRYVGCEIILKDRTLGKVLNDDYFYFHPGTDTVSIFLKPSLVNTAIDSDGLGLEFDWVLLMDVSYFEIHKIWLEKD